MPSLRTPQSAALILSLAIGILTGIGLFTAQYSKAASYLTDDPASCANCHVMNEQYAGWLKGSHRQAAVCNDCHTPAGLIPKYTTKALNGFFHSYAFTTGWFPDVIRINERNRQVTEGACLKCHADIVSNISHKPGDPSCLRCHSQVGHQ